MQYYSFSKISSFKNCPRQFKFENIEKASVEKPVTVEAYQGQAVHKTLENLYQLKTGGRLIPIDEMKKGYLEIWEGPDRDRIKVTREGLGVDDYVKTGAEALEWYYHEFQPFDEGKTIALEKMLNFPIDPNGRFGIRGKVDRITLRPDGVLEIVDYKMKTSLPTQSMLNDDEQMGLYQIGVSQAWPDFKKIELKQIFLRQGVVMSAEMNLDKIEEISYRIYQQILEIEDAKINDNFPIKESGLCDWCVYFELCPAKRHQLALDGEITDDFDAKSGRELASKYLDLNRQIKILKTDLDTLKADIVQYCEATDVKNLAGDIGSLNVTAYESDALPTKTENETAYLDMSLLAREAGLDECFKLDQNVLYKEFYKKNRLDDSLKDRLQKYLIKKRKESIRSYYKKM